MKLLITASIVVTALLGLSQSAHAKGAICEEVQPDLFSIDGMTDDWSSFKVVTYGSGRDARLEVKCAHDDKKLYMMLNVADERLHRTKKADPKAEDGVHIALGVAKATPLRMTILPGSLRAPRKAISVPSFVEVEDSLQDQGFSLELSIPLKKIKDWSPSVPYFTGKIQYHDVDGPSDGKSVVGLKGRVHFAAAVDTYRAFMRTVGLSNRDVKLDVLVDADPGAGPERVIIGGKVLGLVGMSFNYMTLPIADAKDLIRCRVVDFDGSGRYAVLTELRQYGNGGSRDVLVAWFAKGDGSFHPALTVETRKEMGDNSMTNSWALVPRGQHRELEGKKKKRKRRGKVKAPPGRDILLQVGEAVGFDASNYREAPAPDAKGILLPWGEQQSAVYYFEGTSAYGGDVGVELPVK